MNPSLLIWWIIKRFKSLRYLNKSKKPIKTIDFTNTKDLRKLLVQQIPHILSYVFAGLAILTLPKKDNNINKSVNLINIGI
jgi:hypothetical protein